MDAVVGSQSWKVSGSSFAIEFCNTGGVSVSSWSPLLDSLGKVSVYDTIQDTLVGNRQSVDQKYECIHCYMELYCDLHMLCTRPIRSRVVLYTLPSVVLINW
jgi:hypothetical protein